MMMEKGQWGDGPWQNEPDQLEWEHEGFPCLMHRNELMGNWCGYVAVPPGHPAYEKHYDNVEVSVHGGLTYADHCRGPICHVPKPGQPDNVWWLGFDCAHGYDTLPAHQSLWGFMGYSSTYKDLTYVKNETEQLAVQLKGMVTP